MGLTIKEGVKTMVWRRLMLTFLLAVLVSGSVTLLLSQQSEPCYRICPGDYPGNDPKRCFPCCDQRCEYLDDWERCRKQCMSFASIGEVKVSEGKAVSCSHNFNSIRLDCVSHFTLARTRN